MANPTYPGVYVEEISSGVRPIQAAGTSTAAFIGEAEKGSLSEAIKIFNFTEYQNLYGGFLNNSYLAHSVFQFFNNGGAQCYIIRVAGANTQIANIVLKDRGTAAQPSLTVAANSPGVWGNSMAVVITNGTNNPGNEFNLYVYRENELTPLEKFENLSMVPGATNFVEKIISSSKYIRVSVDMGNTNIQAGTSRGASAPSVPLTGTGKTKFRINIDGDGYQEVNLQNAVGTGTGQVTDFNTAENVKKAIQYVVSHLTKQRASTDQDAFDNFTCQLDSGILLLTSGVASRSSSVNVAPASNSSEDASGLLKLGKLNGGVETLGAAVTRPCNNPAGTPPANYFLIGDNNASTAEVVSVQKGSDGDSITNDQPYIDALQLLDSIDDVSLIAVPGIGSPAIVGAGINYCANRSLSDCFFIGDMDQDDDTIKEAETFMAAITPKNSYGSVYLPWLKMLDPTGKSPEPILAGPSLRICCRSFCQDGWATRGLEGTRRHWCRSRWCQRAGGQFHRCAARKSQSQKYQLHQAICRSRDRTLGRTNYHLGSGMDLHSRPSYGNLFAGEHLPGNPMGGL